MNEKRAISLAITCIQRRIKVIAFDANLCDLGIADGSMPKAASKERADLLEAIRILTIIKEQKEITWIQPPLP